MAEIWGEQAKWINPTVRKTKSHAKVCEENILDAYWNIFTVKGANLKDLIEEWGGVSRWYSQGWFTII